jgi:hypothetical protein
MRCIASAEHAYAVAIGDSRFESPESAARCLRVVLPILQRLDAGAPAIRSGERRGKS